MNVILTGARRIGKSTALSRFLTEYSGTAAGFRTSYDADRRTLLLHPIPEALHPPVPLVFRAESAVTVDTAAFDRCIPPLLQQHADLLVLDELGKFERSAEKMRSAAEAAFDSSRNVLAVIRLDAPDWTGALKQRSDVTVLTVTAENRDAIPGQLKALFE